MKLDPKEINTFIAEKVAESVIGEQLKKSMESALEYFLNQRGYGNEKPIESVVRIFLGDAIREMLKTEYLPELKAKLKEKIEINIEPLCDKIFEKFMEKIKYD